MLWRYLDLPVTLMLKCLFIFVFAKWRLLNKVWVYGWCLLLRAQAGIAGCVFSLPVGWTEVCVADASVWTLSLDFPVNSFRSRCFHGNSWVLGSITSLLASFDFVCNWTWDWTGETVLWTYVSAKACYSRVIKSQLGLQCVFYVDFISQFPILSLSHPGYNAFICCAVISIRQEGFFRNNLPYYTALSYFY